MNIMIGRPSKLVLLAIAAAALLPAAAQAHWFDPCRCARPPLYPYYYSHYDRYHHDRYAVRRPHLAVQLAPNVFAIPYHLPRYPYVNCLDGCGYRGVINTVREEPVVIETERVVDEPPRVIERRHVVEGSGQQRVIRAEAEVTILGPDRMNIRLFRKGRGSRVNAPVD